MVKNSIDLSKWIKLWLLEILNSPKNMSYANQNGEDKDGVLMPVIKLKNSRCSKV